jgi:hypothetical protein
MKSITKTLKKPVVYDETNVPGGYCMSGKNLTDVEAKKMMEFIKAQKTNKPKSVLGKQLLY